jgi:hypothetical protein
MRADGASVVSGWLGADGAAARSKAGTTEVGALPSSASGVAAGSGEAAPAAGARVRVGGLELGGDDTVAVGQDQIGARPPAGAG